MEMKKITIVVTTILLFITTSAWAGEYCKICDKRFGKWTPFFSSGFFGDMMPYASTPSGTWFGTPRHVLKGDSDVEVCPNCETKYSELYKYTIDQRKKEFIEHKRFMEQSSIESNRKDNVAYKEKQDEIDKLQKRIQELELERQGLLPLTGWTTPHSGVSKIIDGQALPLR
jgi:hypothetical protein